MVSNKTRVEMIVGNILLQGDAKVCFSDWKKALVSYQGTHRLPDSKARTHKLERQRTELETLSWDFIRLTGNKQSVRDAMIWELGVHKSPPVPNPVELKMGLGDSTLTIAKYEKAAELHSLSLPLHIVVETNTTVEEIKRFLTTNRKQIDVLLSTQKVGTLEPLRVERNKLILQYTKQGMKPDDIAVEIDSEMQFKSLHGEDGISVATVEKIIQRKVKNV